MDTKNNQNKQKHGLTYWSKPCFLFALYLCHIAEHKDKMADTSGHNKQVEDFMRSEKWETSAEYFDLKCVDDAADGIKDSSD